MFLSGIQTIGGKPPPYHPQKAKKQTACGAKNQKIKDRIQRKRLLRKKIDDLRCKIKRLKEKQKMQKTTGRGNTSLPVQGGKNSPL